MSIALRGLEPEVRQRAEWTLAVARYYKVPVTVTSTRRSWAEQQSLYNRYLAGKSKWPAAKPGGSAHQFGLAWDSVPNEGNMPFWIAVRRYAGFNVPVGDEIHASVPNWRNFV